MNADTVRLGIIFAICAALFALLSFKVKGFSSYRKKALIYILLLAFGFSLASLLTFVTFKGIYSIHLGILINIQVYFLLLGIAHIFLMYKFLPVLINTRFIWGFTFTFLINLFGIILFSIAYILLQGYDLLLIMQGGSLFFLIPFCIYKTFDKAVSIPVKIIKRWYYPINTPVQFPTANELKRILIVTFRFHKSPHSIKVTDFRSRAPEEMKFGKLFYYLINNHNEKDPENPIQYAGQNGEPYGWVFYTKSRWFGFVKYIDYDKKVIDNHIKKHSLIYCKRLDDEQPN